MKLTHTLRTIAFSGLGLLAGASTLTIPAQDAHAMSSTPVSSTTIARTSKILLDKLPSSVGSVQISGKCGQAWQQNNYLTGEREETLTYACPGAVTVSVKNTETGSTLLNTSVPLSGQRFVTGLDILVPGDYELEVRYKGGTEVIKGKDHKWSPYYTSRTFKVACRDVGDDLSRDGVDQNCDGVDGIKSTLELSSTGDYGASVGDQGR